MPFNYKLYYCCNILKVHDKLNVFIAGPEDQVSVSASEQLQLSRTDSVASDQLQLHRNISKGKYSKYIIIWLFSLALQ